MVTGYEVSEDGTLEEVEITKEDLDSGMVVCVLDDQTKSIISGKAARPVLERNSLEQE